MLKPHQECLLVDATTNLGLPMGREMGMDAYPCPLDLQIYDLQLTHSNYKLNDLMTLKYIID